MARQEIDERHVATLSAADTSGYWWYAVRQAWVESALRGLSVHDHLDFGCGPGGVLALLTERMAPRRALGLDGTEAAVEVAVSRGLDARYADFRQPLDLPFTPNAITALDVLEHLEDPVLALRNLKAGSTPDARLVVTVPAMPSLHSEWDDICGHFRRYTRATLGAHLREGGWAVERCRYFFSYCVPPAWLQRRVFKTVQDVEFPPVSAPVNALMTFAGRVERALGGPMPLGTSLFAVAHPA